MDPQSESNYRGTGCGKAARPGLKGSGEATNRSTWKNNSSSHKGLIFYIAVLAITIVTGGCGAGSLNQDAGKPNIIFLMDDQHRWDALGVVNPVLHTPALDRLAEEGVFYDQAVCQAPMCIASRNSMMLGLYPNQIGVLRNEPGIPDDELPNRTLAQVFSDAGYQTAGFGKTHWGVKSSTRGFEVRYTSQLPEVGGILMKDVDPEKKKAYDDEAEEYGPGEEDPSGYIGRTSGIPEGWHRDGWIFERCVEFIRQREDDRPLFLYLSFLKPHAGHNVPVGYEDHYNLGEVKYAAQPPWDKDISSHAEGVNRRELYEGFWKNASDEQWRLMTMRYWANCSWMDHMYERTLEALEEKGLLDNTIIIYTSDHGEMLGERYYRFNKYCLYEGSVRVPLIISGSALPEDLRAVRDHRPAELVDVYPTLLGVAGLEIPDFLPGEDLLVPHERKANFCGLHEREGEAAFMWRTREHKLILRFNRKAHADEYSAEEILGGEFYDLKKDPDEWNDIYGNPEIEQLQTGMTAALMDHLGTLGEHQR